MFSPDQGWTRKPPLLLAFACSGLLLLLLATPLCAQIGIMDPDPRPGFGGRNSIEGRIYDPSGLPLNRRVRVVIGGVRGDLSTMTNDNGEFTFRRLPTGMYQLSVEAGEEFQPVTQTVDVRSITGGRMNVINVQLRYREKVTAKPGVVNAAVLNIPKEALKHYRKALESAQKGDPEKAITQLREALAIYPEFEQALDELGVQFIGLNRLDEAAVALEAALKIAPESVRVRADYGLLLLQKGMLPEAEKELRWVLARDGNSPRVRLYLGRTLIGLGQYEEAETQLQTAVSLGGASMHVAHRFLGAIYLQRGEIDRAIAELENFLRAAGEGPTAESVRATIKQLREEKRPQP